MVYDHFVFKKDEEHGLLEYALILGFVVVVIFSAIVFLHTRIKDLAEKHRS